jgi:hypothetical protein
MTHWGHTADLWHAGLSPDLQLGGSGTTYCRTIKVAFRDARRAPPGPGESRLHYDLPPGVSADRVLAAYLGGFVQHTMQILREEVPPACAGGCEITPDRVQWVMAVPPEWTPADRHALREAAVQARMIPDADSDRLLLGIEPEVAGLHALAQAQAQAQQEHLLPGDVYAVLDGGGGTTDVSVHRLDGVVGETSELVAAKGISWGGEALTEGFLDWYSNEVGAEAYWAWRPAHPGEHASLRAAWNTVLNTFGGQETDLDADVLDLADGVLHDPAAVLDPYVVPVPPGLRRVMSTNALAAVRTEHGSERSLMLTPYRLRKLFEPVAQRMVALCQDRLRALSSSHRIDRCSLLIFTGGMALSPWLVDYVRRHLQGDSGTAAGQAERLMVPPQPDAAVLLGATRFGLNPGVIRLRRSKYWYGFRTSRPWEDDAPKDSRVFHAREQAFYSRSGFARVVAKGQDVGYQQVESHYVTPLFDEQRSVEVQFYVSAADRAPKYVREDDPATHMVGSVVVDLQWVDGQTHVDRLVRIDMRLGRVEIGAQAVATGNALRTTIKFSSTVVD